MADNDLDKYLEDIGIDVDAEEAKEPKLPDISEDVVTPVSGFMPADGGAKERSESFLVNLLLNFDPAYAVEITHATDDMINVDIFGGDPGKIIGRGGRTLNALEYLTNAVINRQEDTDIRVNIDVGGYKRRRDERLRNEARKVASRVRRSGQPVEMKQMSAAERRVIHMTIAEDASVVSESQGEGKNRRVVIRPSSES